MPQPPAAVLDITRLAPDVVKLVTDIVKAFNKNSDGGTKITAAEWLKIGQDAGMVGFDILPIIDHK